MHKNKFCPLHCHSYYSLLDGLSSPKDIVLRCKELELPAVALTDHGSIAGLVEFHNAGKKYGIKTISGVELYICLQDPLIKNNDNNKRFHLTVLAKNKDGFNDLMRLVSETNRPEFFYRKPRINLDKLSPYVKNGNILCLSGCLAGELSSSLFIDVNQACKMSLKEADIEKLLLPNWKQVGSEIIKKYQGIFGKDNYMIEIQDEDMPVQKVVIKCLRELAENLGIKKVGTQDSHYTKKEDAEDQRILLYSQMRTTQEEQEVLKESDGDTMAFFHLNTFYIYGQDDADSKYTQDEVENSLLIADICNSFNPSRSPCIPKYKESENSTKDSNDILRDICINNAKTKLKSLDPKKKKIYWDRLQQELSVIKEAGLADYFLIVWDACNFVDKMHGPRGKGRGSGAGSLVNYLTGITKIDPIEYDLYFERFYNASRNIPAHFDVGKIPFMTWYEQNFEKLYLLDDQKREDMIMDKMRKAFADGRKVNNEKILKEISWINNNNRRMWSYIADAESSDDNVSNSCIAWVLSITDTIDNNKDVVVKEKHISLPDIDTDIGIEFREKLIEYLMQKWGYDRVSQMITFGRLQGRAALKEVFRSQPDTVKHLMKVRAMKLGKNPNEISERPIDICNEITKFVPDEASIADELQQIREETDNEDYGILQWSIDHIDYVKDAYQWFKPLFDQAMRLEGTKRNQSKHAAGIIITPQPIEEIVPLTYDANSKNRICGLEMDTAEKLGCVKFDFLGVAALDKIKFAERLVNGVQ